MQAAKETLVIVRQAGRLLLGYWPTLLVLAFAGMTARYGMLKLAVLASEVHRLLGMLVFALVPLGLLIALVLMLASMRRSLPSVAGLDPGRRPAIADLASVLVPFLVVYAALDYFTDDRGNYLYFVWRDEATANPEIFTDPSVVDMGSRLVLELDWWTVGVVIAAGVLRWLLGLWRRSRGRVLRNLAAAYLEVVWLTLAAVTIFLAQEQIMNRRFVVWVRDAWASFVDALGPLAGLGRFLGQAAMAADTVLLIPLAWLAVGAVVYGRRLPYGPDLLSRRARRRWLRLPRRLRSDIRGAFGPLWDGLRLLRRGGLATMLGFCLVFGLAQFLPALLFLLQRQLIGPRDPVVMWMPLSSVLSAVNTSIGAVVLVCLVASAVNRLLGLTRDASAGQVEADVSGQLFESGYPYGRRDGVAWRDEENEGLISV